MPGRMLRLLSLLQSRREWSGHELADRLGVTERTVRRDVERLRSLDYPVTGTTGTAGGYRLGSGTNLPPLQLDDDEAIAVALGLVGAAGGGVSGMAESSMSALAKLEQVLPARLRPQLAAVSSAAEAIPRPGVPQSIRGPRRTRPLLPEPRDRCLRLPRPPARYDATPGRAASAADGRALVPARVRPERDDWRIFRVDRIASVAPACTASFRVHAGGGRASYLLESFVSAQYEHSISSDGGGSSVDVTATTSKVSSEASSNRRPSSCMVRFSADTPALLLTQVAADRTPRPLHRRPGDPGDRRTHHRGGRTPHAAFAGFS